MFKLTFNPLTLFSLAYAPFKQSYTRRRHASSSSSSSSEDLESFTSRRGSILLMDLPSPTLPPTSPYSLNLSLKSKSKSKAASKAQDAEKSEDEETGVEGQEADALAATLLSNRVYDDDAQEITVESEADIEMAVLRNGIVRNSDDGKWVIGMLVDVDAGIGQFDVVGGCGCGSGAADVDERKGGLWYASAKGW